MKREEGSLKFSSALLCRETVVYQAQRVRR